MNNLFSLFNAWKADNWLSGRILPRMLRTSAFTLTLLCLAVGSLLAQPPSHDPSTMIRNNDGRYWIFTTGDGIWCMSSSNRDFTDWRVEPAPFANGFPSWIHNYVDGFNGFFWAPDVIKIGSTYYLYYSCAGNGAPAAIGVATAPDLAGPWTDRGMVVAGNNAIDPAVYMDGGNLWMTWGNWQSGIDIVQLNPSTGKRLNSTTHHLVSGQVEGPGLIKNGNYYYLFYQRGLCCNGLNSSYYMVVARSTNITGPYTGERTFLPNWSGNIVGPGHFGYGEGRLTYHYYDANDNGAAKLMITTLGWSGGWPVAGGSGGGSSSFYQLQNRGTGLFLDGMGRTVNGEACGQYGNTNHVNSHWELVDVGGGYYQLKNRGTGLFLDGMGRTANGDDVGQWANTNHHNSHWTLQQYDGSYYRLRNRGTGLYLDGMGRTSNGANCGQWGNTTHPNAQWRLLNAGAREAAEEMEEDSRASIAVYPNPVRSTLNIQLTDEDKNADIRIFNVSGQLMIERNLTEISNQIDVRDLKQGIYFLEISTDSGTKHSKFIKR